jgi:hypothetical protein
MAELHELSYSQCEAILRAGVVGRIAVWADGPHIMPMNYSVVDEAIIMRTAPDSVLGRQARGAAVAFEVDHFDYAYHRGCSVVARGQTEIVEDPAAVAHIHAVWEPRPWAHGDRSLLLRLRWTELSGRQLGTGWDPMSELPVRRTL